MSSRAWPRWWHRMDTQIHGGASGPVLSGSFDGPVASGGQGGQGGESHVTIHLDHPEPSTPREYLKTLWLMQLTAQEDAREYRERREQDEWLHRRVMYGWLTIVSVLMGLVLVVVLGRG